MLAMVNPGLEVVDLRPHPNYAATGGIGKLISAVSGQVTLDIVEGACT